MTQELRERVEKAIRKLIKPQHPQQVANIADAAIAIIRGETLEEAARVVSGLCSAKPYESDWEATRDMALCDAAAAIRALKEGKS